MPRVAADERRAATDRRSRGLSRGRLAAFDAGADDYVTRPVSAAEIGRRARALLRRTRRGLAAWELRGPDGVVLQLRSQIAYRAGRQLHLTQREFSLLALLLEHRGDVLDLEHISSAVWGFETLGSPNFVQQQISRLRRKLRYAGAEGVIETVHGVGYRVPPEARGRAA